MGGDDIPAAPQTQLKGRGGALANEWPIQLAETLEIAEQFTIRRLLHSDRKPMSTSRAFLPKPDRAGAFTLIELLVVIAIIAILASILFPSLAFAKERARRTQCLNNVRQFILSCHVYANDHNNRLPVPGTDYKDTRDTHTPVFGTNEAKIFLPYTSLSALDCPDLHRWMEKPDWRIHPEYGMAIGYHYLGGHPGTPWDFPPGTTNAWISPQQLTDNPQLTLVADLNVYCTSITKVLAPHTRRGPVIHDGAYYVAINQTGLWDDNCVLVGAEGGNIGSMDGAVTWRAISKLNVYKASHLWDTSGAYGYWWEPILPAGTN